MASPEAIAAVATYLQKTIGETIPRDELDGWGDVLEPIRDDGVVIEAVRRVVRTMMYRKLPAPGAIYQAAMEILRERFPSTGEAWQRARRGELTSGPVAVAFERIGAGTMHNLREGDSATRARFLEFYREAVDAAALEYMANPELEQEALPAIEAGDLEALPVYEGTAEQRAAMYGEPPLTPELEIKIPNVRELIRRIAAGEGDIEELGNT